MSRQVIPIEYVGMVTAHLDERGIDREQILRPQGISIDMLDDPDAHISYDCYANLVTNLMLAMGDEGLGYYRRPIPIGSWSMMCYAATSARTLREALLRYCRFFSLLDVGITPRLLESDKLATIRLVQTPSGLEPARFVSERGLLHCHRFSSWLIERELPVSSVGFRHERPAGAARRPLFPVEEIHFAQPYTQLSFSVSLLDTELQRDTQALQDFLRSPVLNLLTANQAVKSWCFLVKREVGKDLGRVPSMHEGAARLGVHPQTLRRRLATEGFTYKALIDDVRRSRAIHLLQSSRSSVEDVAYGAGFSETSTFTRAFRRWTGMTPLEYRRTMETRD